MKLINLFALLLLPVLCTAQTWNWADAYVNHPGSNSSNYIKSLKLDTSGNLVMSGYAGGDTTVIGNDTLLYNGLPIIGFVAKLTNSGAPIWAKPIHNQVGWLYSAIDPIDNGIYIASSFSDSLTLGGTTVYSSQGEYFIARMDSNGTYQWLRNFGTDQANWVNANFGRIATDVDGNVYFGGTCGSLGYFATDTLADSNGRAFVVKYDRSGNEQWVKQLGQGGSVDIYEVAVDDDKNIFITGSTRGIPHFDTFTITTPNPRTNTYLVKLDSNSVVSWAVMGGGVTPFNIPGQIYPSSLGMGIKVTGNNIYWTGGFADTVVFGGNVYGPTCGTAYCLNFFLANYDQQGNFKWFKQGEGATAWSLGDDVEADGEGHVYVTGEFNYDMTLDGIQVTTPFNGFNYMNGDRFVAKYDTSGICQWLINTATVTGSADMTLSCSYPYLFIAGDYEDTVGTLGTVGLPVPGFGQDNIFLGAINNSMNCPTTTTKVKVSAAVNSLTIFPNPSSDYVMIKLPQAIEAAGCTASAFNNMGQLMSARKMLTSSEKLDVSSYPPGVYTIRVADGKGNTIGGAAVVKQ